MSGEIVYRELRPGEVIQPEDEWQTESGRWALFHQSMIGQPVRDRGNRRPYNITQLQKEQREAGEAVAVWQRAGQAAFKERDEARAAMQDAHRECDALRRERDRLAHSVNEWIKENQHLRAELAPLQQSTPPANHIADAGKMAETELEQKAWELYLRRHVDQEDAFNKAERFIAERNRRRQAGMTTTDVVGD